MRLDQLVIGFICTTRTPPNGKENHLTLERIKPK